MVDRSRGFFDRWGLLVVLAVALLVRVVYLFQYHATGDWSQLTVDANYHHHWAQDIAAGDVFGDTTYFRAPFYVFCLALLYAVLGDSLWIGRLFGLAIGLASVALTSLLARRLFGAKAGFFAGLVHALCMMAVYFEPELLVDPLYTLLLLAALHGFVTWYDSRAVRDALTFAVLLGLAAITRPNALVMVPVAVLVLAVRWRRIAAPVPHLGALALGLLLVIGPITLRNYLKANDPALIATSGGINLYIGNNPEADGAAAVLPPPMGPYWRLEQTEYIAESDLGRDLTPGEVSAYWTDRALAWMKDNPGAFLRLYARKFFLFFSNAPVSNNRDLEPFISRIAVLRLNPVRFALVFGLAVAGLAAGALASRPLRWILLFVALSILSGAVFFYATRFRLPLEPVYFALAGFALARLPDLWRESRLRCGAALGGGILAALVSFALPGPPVTGYSIHPLVEAGGYEYQKGNYVQAWRHYQMAAAVDSVYPGVNTNIGSVLLALEQADSAEVYFQREVRFNPWYAPGWTSLAHVAMARGDLRGAIGMARQALARAPYAAGPNLVLVRALAADTAVSDDSLAGEIARAAQRARDDIYLLQMGAELLLNRGALAPASRFARRALEAEGPPIEMDHEAFRHDFRNSRDKLNSQRAAAAVQLAYIAGNGNDIESAIAFARRAVELAPHQAEGYLNLYSGLTAAGRTAEAGALLKEMAERFPDNRFVREMLRRR